jgi:sterol desaturase/sphingolipid hydroxylase (fatty acid hydroxylase superfamily)
MRALLTALLRPVADATVLSQRSGRGARMVDLAVVLGLTAAGLASPWGVLVWYGNLLYVFAVLAGLILLGCAVVTVGCAGRPRIQGPRRRPARIALGARETAIAAWIAACFAAWPLTRAAAGLPIGLTWSIDQAGGPLAVFLQNLLGILVIDAWLYWKHRLLHTRLLFPFHRGHHVHRDPTAFAGFAVGPLESLLTFWPIVLVAFPWATHYGPVYFPLIAAFILLNFYLHCGITSPLLEALLPRAFVNTSVFHNRHHADAEVHFGEALTLWDRLCRTRAVDRRSKPV